MMLVSAADLLFDVTGHNGFWMLCFTIASHISRLPCRLSSASGAERCGSLQLRPQPALRRSVCAVLPWWS